MPCLTNLMNLLRNCNGDIAQLRSNLTNIVDHYTNNQDNCHPTSLCVVDPNYEPSRIVITKDRAADLLLNVITSSTIYKSPQDFMLAMDTYPIKTILQHNKLHGSSTDKPVIIDCPTTLRKPWPEMVYT